MSEAGVHVQQRSMAQACCIYIWTSPSLDYIYG